MCVSCVETLWSVAKANFDKFLLLETEPLTEARFHHLVNRSIQVITKRTLNGIINSNRRFIARLLKEQEV